MASYLWTGRRFDVEWPYPSYYRKGKVLGRGTTSTMYLATSRWLFGEPSRAIKSVDISQHDALFEEWWMLLRFGLLYIIGYHRYEHARDTYDPSRSSHNLILDYISGGTLKEKICIRFPRGLCVSQVREIGKDILNGLACMHGNNIVHLDINPTNILPQPTNFPFNKYGHLSKIADFGLTMDADLEKPYGHRMAHKSRDIRYKSLELIRFGTVDFAVDIWAFGCTVLEMLTGQPPWKQCERYGRHWWKEVDTNEVSYILDWYCEDTKDFLRNCLNWNAGESWAAHALLNHQLLIDTVVDDIDM